MTYLKILSSLGDLRKWNESRDSSNINIAISKLQKAIAIDPKYDDFYVGMGQAWYRLQFSGFGEVAVDSVLVYTQKALERNSLNDAALSLQAKTYWRKGQFKLSKTNAEKALEIAPNNIDALYALSAYYQSVEKAYDKAIPLMLKSIALSPNNSNDFEDNQRLYRVLGNIYIEIDDLDKAETFYRKYYELNPSTRLANSALGFVLRCQQRFDEALPYSKREYELGHKNFRSTDEYAFALMAAGKYKKALEKYEELNDMVNKGFQETASTHTFRHRYAFVLWQLGQKEKADSLFALHIEKELDFIKEGTRLRGQEFDLAGVYAFTGEKEKAYEMLEQMPLWYVTYQFLKFDPMFDALREEPRFQRIQQKLEKEVAQIRAQVEKYQTEGGLMFSVE